MTGDEIQQYILDYMQRNHITDVKVSPALHGLSKFMITFGKTTCHLLYSSEMKVRKYDLEADLIHELGVHYRRYANGKVTGRHLLTF